MTGLEKFVKEISYYWKYGYDAEMLKEKAEEMLKEEQTQKPVLQAPICPAAICAMPCPYTEEDLEALAKRKGYELHGELTLYKNGIYSSTIDCDGFNDAISKARKILIDLPDIDSKEARP
ncbi:hypothetical protein CCP3SC1AL1_110016 [Gammaproteobacteria bacterium]